LRGSTIESLESATTAFVLLNPPTTVARPGHTAYVDPKTGRAVIVDDQGNMVAAFRLGKKQLEHVMSGGNLN
jgi:hypothetical protein